MSLFSDMFFQWNNSSWIFFMTLAYIAIKQNNLEMCAMVYIYKLMNKRLFFSEKNVSILSITQEYHTHNLPI